MKVYAGMEAEAAEVAASGKPPPPGLYMTGVVQSKVDEIEHLAVDVPASPGDLVLFGNILVHRGGQNDTETARWTMDWRFQDAEKSTLRSETGHVIWAAEKSASNYDVVSNAREWASAKFQ